MWPEGKEFLDCEQKGQIYVPVSVVDTYPKNLSFCNICGKFPDWVSLGETSYDMLRKWLTMVFLNKLIEKKSGRMSSQYWPSQEPLKQPDMPWVELAF